MANPTVCNLADTQPQLLAVDHPYLRKTGTTALRRRCTVDRLRLRGHGGHADGRCDGAVGPRWHSWTRHEDRRSPCPTRGASGALPISIIGANGTAERQRADLAGARRAAASTPGNTATNPQLAEVGPGKQYATIQAALESRPARAAERHHHAASRTGSSSSGRTPHDQRQPAGRVHRERDRAHAVQDPGRRSGRLRLGGTFVPGSIIDGSGFSPDNTIGHELGRTCSSGLQLQR